MLFTEQIVAINWTHGLRQTVDKNKTPAKTIDNVTNRESDSVHSLFKNKIFN